MKKLLFYFLITIFFSNIASANNSIDYEKKMENTKITLTIKDKEFSAVLYKNDTTNTFINMLPLTLNMIDLNDNEKYYNLFDKLPVNSEKVGSIKKGDIMLYGDNCIVVFYESFNTPYRYTKIGHIEDVYKLSETLGSGNINITFKK